jgi:uncharacterized protein
MSMRKRNVVALVFFGSFYMLFGVYITLSQEKIVYQPFSQDFEVCPGFSSAEKVTVGSTRMYVRSGERGRVVLYHGNAGSACDRDFYTEWFVRAGYGYVIPEYAGYSNDPQETTHELVKEDVRNVLAYLASIGEANELVVGESVGTGVAAYHTSLHAPRRLLLISPFASLKDVARRRFWYYPTSIMVDNAFDNSVLLGAYRGPVTIMHGEDDMIIAYASGKKLYDSLPTIQKQFVSLTGVGHNDVFSTPVSYEAVQVFLVGQ